MGHLKRIWKHAFCLCSSEMLRGPGADFLRGVACLLGQQTFRFAEMILRDRCSTSYDLASLFRGRRSISVRWSGQIAKSHAYEVLSSALNLPLNLSLAGLDNRGLTSGQILTYGLLWGRRQGRSPLIANALVRGYQLCTGFYIFGFYMFEGNLAEMLCF